MDALHFEVPKVFRPFRLINGRHSLGPQIVGSGSPWLFDSLGQVRLSHQVYCIALYAIEDPRVFGDLFPVALNRCSLLAIKVCLIATL